MARFQCYAVAVGRRCGVYESWTKCKEAVKGFTGAEISKQARCGTMAFVLAGGGTRQSSQGGQGQGCHNDKGRSLGRIQTHLKAVK